MATLGKNQVFEIKNGDGTSFHNLVLRKSAVESVVMSLGDKISGDVYYKDNSLSVTMHEYITYNEVNYILVNPPTIVREGIVSNNSELKGMTKYSFVFYHPMCQLANFQFLDVAVTSDETRYLSEGKTFSWIGKPADFVAKLNKNLTGTEWIVEISSRFPQDKLDELSNVIPFDNATIADACKTFYDTWGVPYAVDKVASTEASYATGKRFKLVMGLPSNEIYENASAEQQNIPFVFQMGHGVGLKNNSRTPRNNKIITRISGYGSENNIPYGYPQIRWYGTAGQSFTYGDHAGVYTDVTIGGVHFDKVVSYPIYKGILNGEYVELIKHPFTRTHLMPSIYRTTLFNKISLYNELGEVNTDYNPDITLVDYYDAIYSAQYPYPNTINIQAPSYESHEFENEKPELGEAHIISATPLNNDLTPASSWDDSLDDEGNYKQSYFQMVLPQLSFDLYACASITEEMQINMRSGTCLGCTFTVQVDWDDYKRNFYDEEGNFAPNGSQRDLTKYPKSNQGSISLVLQKDNSTFGTLMPNMYQYPKGDTSSGAGNGDTFVILGISLPESYIFAAEMRLDADMKSYMLENNVHYFDYPLKFDEDFLFHNENILSQIHPNTVVRFNYAGQTQALFVKQITVKYGDQPLPQYDITLTDNVEVALNQIGQVAEDVEKLSTLIAILRQSYGKNVWNELAKKLSKTQDDTAAGYITMLKGLQIGANFIPDILGEGGVLRMRDDGKVELVTDILYARVKAYFDSVEIRKYQYTGGNRIASVAGNKICRVAWFDSSNEELEQTQANLASVAYFRCYFRASDGEDTVRNNWVVGDQAYCHITSVTTGSDNPEEKGLNQKHLWRLVIGRNIESTLTEDGEAYIDLSNRATETISGNSYTGYQSGSDIPEAQDDIIQLGNVNDTTRQGAIVEFVTGTDAPSYQIYQGISSFSLNGKNQIGFGYNTGTGRAYLNVYGDFRFGSRPNTQGSYIAYNQQTGNLDIKANVTFTNTREMSQFVKDNQNNYDDSEVKADIAMLDATTQDLQKQIDGAIETWFMTGVPTLQNAPANEWTTDDEKDKHIGDLYYDKTTGHGYRFMYDDEEEVYLWTILTDEDVTEALRLAAQAQETADGKRTVYSVWGAWMKNNVNTLEVGDLFIPAANTTQGGVTYKAKKVYKCTAKGSATFEEIAYTDDSKFNGYINAFLNGTGASGDSAIAAAIQKAIAGALGSGTVVAGGLLLTSLIGMRQYNGTGDKSDISSYTTWAGISGQYDANALGGGMAAWYGGGMLDKEMLTPEQIGTVDPQTGVETGWPTLRWAKGIDRFDGSGYRANGNITWNEQGQLVIKNITTLSDSNNKNILNELATFNSAFTFGTTGSGSTTALYITPQVPFESLYIGTSNSNKKAVATQDWVNDNYVSISFFERLFNAYNGNTKVSPNSTAAIDNIKAMFGFWTEQYISALGKGDDTGGGGTGDVTWDLLASTATGGRYIDSSYITAALAPYATQSWVNGRGYATQSWVTEQGYATQAALNALEYMNGITGGNGFITFGTNKGNSTVVDFTHEHSFLELLDRPDTIAGYGITLTADDIPMLTKNKISDFPTTWAWSAITGTPNSIAGYGITDAKIENGVITLGGNSITPLISETYRGTVVSVGLSVPAGFSVSGTPITDSGTLAIDFASGYEGFTTDLKNKINALFSWFEVDANGNIKTKDYTENNETKHRGFYSPSFISALGQGSDSGGGGQGDVTWTLLAQQATNNRTIHRSYIADILSSYATTSWVTGLNYATQTWVEGKGYATTTQLNALEFLSAVTGGDGVVTLTTNKNNSTILDLSHEHSFLELLDRPTTIAGYGITDAVKSIMVGTASYTSTDGTITLPTYYITTDSRAANTVLAAPNGASGAATFRALVAADIPTLTKSKISDFPTTWDWSNIINKPTTWAWTAITGKPTTIAGYGITDAKIVDGVITLGAVNITPITSVAMTVPSGFSISGSPISKAGTLALSYASGYEGFTTELKNKINSLFSWFEVDSSGNVKTKDYTENGTTKHRGFYSPSFVSALGQGDDGQSGVGDVTWELLAASATGGRTIHLSYISSALASYLTSNSYIQSSAISDMATKTWVGQQDYLKQASLSNYYTKSEVYTKTEVNALARVKAISASNDGLTFTWQDGATTIADFSHEHSFLELLDRPTTVKGYGIVITADDIPSLPWGKITSGKPTTIAGYGITDAVTSVKIGTNSYAPASGIVTLPAYPTNYYSNTDSHTANTVLAAPNGSSGVATFRSLVAADIPTLTKSKISDFPTSWAWSALTGVPTTIAGYGITDAHISNGVITLGANTITPITSVAMTVPTGFSVSGSPISKTGTFAVSYASGYEGFTTTLKDKINLLYSLFTREGSGTSSDPYIIKANYGLYTEKFLSALGQGDDGQSGVGDVTWTLLASQATDGRTIHTSYLTQALSGYATQSWVTNQNYATQTWVTGQGYATSASVTAAIGALTYFNAAALVADGTIKLSGHGVEDTYLDFTHQHSWFDIQDRPDTLTGFGITIAASDIPNLDWSKITTGKPTTIAGYGIADGVTQVKIGTTAYTPTSGVISLPAYPTVPTKVSQLANDSGYITSSASITGNSASATKLKNTIKLWGNDFDGTADIGDTIVFNAGDSGRQVRITKGGLFEFRAGTGGWAGGFFATSNDGSTTLGAFGYNGSGDTLTYLFIGDNFSSPWVSFLPSGRVGIGTKNPTCELDVSGSVNATTLYENGNRVITTANIGSQSVNYATSAGSATTATTASKLSTVSKTLFGNTYWTSGGVPTSIGVSGANASLSYVANITMSGALKIGDIYLTYDSANNAIRVSKNADGTGVANFYAIGGVSALGQGEDGSAGVGDVTWELLASTATGGRFIDVSYISGAMGNYLTANGYVRTVDITDMATRTWVGQQGYITSASIPNSVVSLSKVLDGVVRFGYNNGSSDDIDLTHEHSWFDIQDRPDTLKGFGVTLTAADIPNLSWSKITSGKPTTVAGYGITDAITTGNIGNQSVSYATTAGTANSVSWGNVGNKPSAAGNGTTPVYWTGSGFTACTPYSSASVNYANSAGSVAWTNVTSHPTKLSQFTNDSGYVTSSGVTSVATGTGLTGGTITSTGTISINSTYQTYISHGESAYNSLGNYLPLSGGTMTGTLKLTTGISISDSQYGGLLVCKPTDWTGVTSSQWGVGNALQGVIRSSDTPLIHFIISGSSGTAYEIIDSKGGQTINSSLQIGSSNGAYLQIGAIRLVYDSSNNAVKVIKSDGGNANFYATGGVSALGAGQESGDEYMKVTPTNDAYNANNIYNAGLYELSAGSSNLPFGAQYGVVLSLPYRNAYGNTSTDFSTQIALPNGDDSSYPNSMFYRTSLSSSWNAWQRVQNVSMSDVRLKTILSNPTFDIRQIANAPIIRYLWSKEGYGDKKEHIGSTAQYWMNVANEFVEQEYNGYYSLQYGVAALISAITVARKVMTHEEKIALLETRVSALEKENGEQEMLINSLQEELAKFKAA